MLLYVSQARLSGFQLRIDVIWFDDQQIRINGKQGCTGIGRAGPTSLQGLATWRLQSAKNLPDDFLKSRPAANRLALLFWIELLYCDRLTGA
jgi:hypothetical protein